MGTDTLRDSQELLATYHDYRLRRKEPKAYLVANAEAVSGDPKLLSLMACLLAGSPGYTDVIQGLTVLARYRL